MSDRITVSLDMDTPQPKNRLLLVDGDPKSLRVLDVSLKKAGFEVTTASSSHEALTSLEAELPDLIISDTDLVEMDGFELCNRIKAKPEWAKIPFLFVSGRKSIEDKIRGLELGVDDYLTKPIYIKEIGIRVRTALQRAERERMESRREGRTRFAGDLSDVGVVDLVQTIELNRKSGIIHIVNRDERRGSIFFRDGKVIDAEVGRLSGAHALYRLFSWSEGQFAVEFKQIRRHDVIDMSMAALLMEGMRRLDESTRLLESLPSSTGVLEVDCRVLAEELAELPDEMNSVLRLCDGARTLQEVVEDSDLPDLETLDIINKLFLGQVIFAREAPERGGESEPGVRLAHWLSEGGAENPAAVPERRTPSEPAMPSDLLAGAEVLPSRAEAPVSPVDQELSAEETLGAMLPSRGDATLGESIELARAADTLKGIPVENLFSDQDGKPEGKVRVEVAGETSKAEVRGAQEPRSTKPLGLAERLLSEDSALRAAAMHEAISDDDGKVKEPVSVERNTHAYGDPMAEAAAALVQEVVSSTHESKREAIPAAEPERPKKEVDWGAWPAFPSPDPPTAGKVKLDPVKPAADPTPVAKPQEKLENKPKDSKTSSSELDTADLQEVEPGHLSAMASPPALGPPATPPTLRAWPSSRPPADTDARAEPREEAATRLLPEDILPMEAEPPAASGAHVRDETEKAAKGVEARTGSFPGGGAEAVSASNSAESGEAGFEARGVPLRVLTPTPTAMTWSGRRRSQAREVWLMVIGGFALGMVGFLALGRKAFQPSEPPSAVVSPPAAVTPPAAPAPAAALPAPAAPSAAAPSAGATPPPAEIAIPTKPMPVPEAAKPVAVKPAAAPAQSGGEETKAARVGAGPAALLPTPAELREKCLEVNAEGRGKAKAVAAACRPALEAAPKDAEVMVVLARVEIDRGHLVEARSLAKKALATDPQRLEAYVYLGTAEQEAGKVEEARAAYKKYLELAPDGPFARELRAILSNL